MNHIIFTSWYQGHSYRHAVLMLALNGYLANPDVVEKQFNKLNQLPVEPITLH